MTSDDLHPASQLTDLVHQRARLGILSILAESRKADFSYLKSLLALTDGNLGRHLEVLESEGLVSISKGFEGRRPRTWVEITSTGLKALSEQMRLMKKLVNQFEAGPRSAKASSPRSARIAPA